MPLRSAVTRWVVDCSCEIDAELAVAGLVSPWLSYGSPAATGLFAALSPISARRSSANELDTRPLTGTLKNAGSAR